MRLANTFTSACLVAASFVQSSVVGMEEPVTTWGGLFNSIIGRASGPPGEKVPGDSQISHCKGTGPQDMATLNFIDILPRVLRRNSPVAVNTSASLAKTIGDDIIVELVVKYSVIPIKIINRKDPMCLLVKQIGLECPFAAGDIDFQKQVMVPDRFIPSGMYHIKVNAYSKDGTPLTCLDIEQKFK